VYSILEEKKKKNVFELTVRIIIWVKTRELFCELLALFWKSFMWTL